MRSLSSLVYGALTRKREEAPSKESTTKAPPGVRPYVDALAALVPGEVLAAQVAILSVTTTTKGTGADAVTTITNHGALKASFLALLAISALLYVIGHWSRWDRWDLIRVFIPPTAFVGWTMATQPSVFDGVADWSMSTRYVITILGGLVAGVVATALSYKADADPPPG